jgi:hypothetical protein
LFKKPIKQLPADPFLQRLGSTIIGEGMLNAGNLYLMDLAIQKMPLQSNIIEIGSYAGMSAAVIIHLQDKHSRNDDFFTCDCWKYEGVNDKNSGATLNIDGRKDIPRETYNTYIKNAFINAMNLLCKHRLPHTFQLTSDAFLNAWDTKKTFTDVFGRETILGGSVGFAYIDGDHSLQQTKKDFHHLDPQIIPGGYVLFDDSSKAGKFGSGEFMNEMLKDKNYELVDINPNYLFKKKI